MQLKVTLALLSLAGFLGQAVAQSACPSGSSRVSNVQSLVSGRTLCAARGSDRWQEFHNGGPSGGALIDYKLGAGHAVDPTKTVGAWSAQNGANSLLTHSYTGGASYPWLVCQVGSSSVYALVSTGAAGTITGATFLGGQVACP